MLVKKEWQMALYFHRGWLLWKLSVITIFKN